MSESTIIATQNPFRRGPGGRPTRAEAERRHQALLDTASRLFIAKGLDGVSLEAIAEEAGVAKRFVYARYKDKSDLFVDTLRRLIEDRVAFLGGYDVGAMPAYEGLLAFGEQLEAIAIQPQALALYRIIITEWPRFPALKQLFAEKMQSNVLNSVTRILATYRDGGEIHFRDAGLAAELFLTLVIHGARGRALIDMGMAPHERRQRLEAAVRLFVEGHRLRP
jgi:TetR/AcrR family transcriptional regulator, mexJK operon transcriptional repressor